MTQDAVSLGVVGLGGWGKFVVKNFATTSNCRLSYVCDANRHALAQQARQFPDATPTDSFETLLADESLDAIALATPAPFHHEMAKRALLAGKHVFVEKPMTLVTEHALELVEIAEQNDRKLMVGHLLKYHPAVQLMKNLVDEGSLGQIHYMYCQRLNLGVVRTEENAFWSLAPHDVSVILHLFEQEPEHIVANGQSFLQPDIEDVVFATMYFPDGRVANIHVSWLDPHKKRSMVLVGSEKMLVFDDQEANEKVRIYDKSASIDIDAVGMNAVTVRHGDILIPRLSTREPLAAETQHFVDCILNDTQPLSDGHDGVRVVRILEAIDRQFRQKMPVRFRKAA